jgi:protein TonB
MEKVTTASLTLDDIVFENRNRAYGAYDLRASYEGHLMRALVLAPLLLITLIIFPVMINQLTKLLLPETNILEKAIGLPPPQTILSEKDLVILLEKPSAPLPPQNTNTQKYVPYKPVPDDQLNKTEELTTAAMLEDAVAGPITLEGTGTDLPPVEAAIGGEGGTGLSSQMVAEPENKIFIAVEQMPEFPGGQAALMKFISKHLRYPRSAVEKGITGLVYVTFVIDPAGKVTQIEVLKGIDPACDEEAVRVISKLPDWKPGRQSGRNVSVRYSFPIRYAM